MNINLNYEGKNYNFDVPKNVKIDYLKDLSSKLFKSDKKLLELMCNNIKIDGKNEDILIQDLIPKDKTSTILTVQMNEDLQKEKIQSKELSPPKKSIEVKSVKKENKGIKNSLSNNDEIYENRLFIANYIKKSNELFLTIKNFNDKIKEIDNKLNRKMKNFNIDSDNNIFYYELSLFEKRVIDFQNSQINYYKELIHILNKNDNGDEIKEINFDTFYNKILLNNYEDILGNEYKPKKTKKNKYKLLPNIEKINNSKSINKVGRYDDITDLINTKLPILKNNIKSKKNLLVYNDVDKIKIDDNNLHTIDNEKMRKKINNNILMDEDVLKENKLNLKTENKNNKINDEKEIKYQNENLNNKSKIKRKNNKKDTDEINKNK
jgi:hypothetical protein